MKVQDSDLGQLVDACRNQDRIAQHALYQQFVDRVHGLVARMVGRNEADDVTQNVFLQVFRSLETFRHESRFETWLYRLVVNEALQYRRRNRHWPIPALRGDSVAAPAGATAPNGDAEMLGQALESLAPELRTLFVLREVDGLSYRELADVMGIPEGTVGSRLNRARQELRDAMLARGWED